MDAHLENRFCGHCGISLVPLDVPHASGSCDLCGKTRYFVRRGDGGQGIKIEAGESFTIPAEWLTVSFDPLRSKGRLARPGVPFLLRRLILSGMPPKPDEFIASLRAARDAWGTELWSSDRLAGIDPASPTGGDEASDRLKEDKECWEWNMLMRDLHAAMAIDGVEQKDAVQAAYCALYTGLFHGLSVVSEPYFEETVWRGYLAGIAVHEAGRSGDHVLGEVEALRELDQVLKRVGEATLHTWITSGAPIGPRLGIATIPENLLAARAKWHLEEFKREREDKAKAPAESRAEFDVRLRGLSLLWTVIASAIGGGVIVGLFK